MRSNPGIYGETAPELKARLWIDAGGNPVSYPVSLTDFKDQIVILFCFQSWCKSCHRIGFPALKQLIEILGDHKQIAFLAIQMGLVRREADEFERLADLQDRYRLTVPFGQDGGDETTGHISPIVHDYRTGGTPWFVLIDAQRKVIYNNYQLSSADMIKFLNRI